MLKDLNLEPFLLHVQDCLHCRGAAMTLGFAAMQGKLPPIEDAENVLSALCDAGRESIAKVHEPKGTTPLPHPKLQPALLNEAEAAARRAETLRIMAEVEKDEEK